MSHDRQLTGVVLRRWWALKDPALKEGRERPQNVDHLAELWMKPRPGGWALDRKVPHQAALPFTPSFLPPLSNTQIRPIRPPVLSPSASQKTVDSMFKMHENRLFGDTGVEAEACRGSARDRAYFGMGLS